MSSSDFKKSILDADHRAAMERQTTTPSFTALLESIVVRRKEMTKAASESKIALDLELLAIKDEDPFETVKNLYYNLTESSKKSWREKTKKFESIVESAKNVAIVVPKNMVSSGNIRETALFENFAGGILNKIPGTNITSPKQSKALLNTIIAVKGLAKEYGDFMSDLTYIETTRTDMGAQHTVQVTALKAAYPTETATARFTELETNLEAVAKLEQDIASNSFRPLTNLLGVFNGIHVALVGMTDQSITLDPFYDIITGLCRLGESVADASINERDMIQAIGSSGEGRIMKANKDLLRAVQSIEDALWSSAAHKTEITDRLIKNQFEASRVRADAVKAAGNNQPDATIETVYKQTSSPKPTTSEIDKGLLGSRPGFEGLR